MNIHSRILLVSFAVLSSVLCVGYAIANRSIADDSRNDPTYILDGEQYKKSFLINDFISIAFAKKDWPIDDGEDNFLKYHAKADHVNRSRYDDAFFNLYPWLKPYLNEERHFRSDDRLYRWNTESIGIGFDWPQYTKRMPPKSDDGEYECALASEHCDFMRELSSGKHNYIIDHVKDVSSRASRHAKLNIVLQGPDDIAEQTENYAKIRIIFSEYNKQRNFFKFYRYGKGQESLDWSIHYNEHELRPAISFTVDTRSQVDGYIVLSKDNELGMSVCKMSSAIGVDLIKSLISECIARSLGLPGLSMNSKSIFGNWNRSYDSSSFLKDLDGRAVALKKFGDPSDRLKAEDFSMIQSGKHVHNYTEYDAMMIRLLYCGLLKAGDSRDDVRRKLSKSNICFNIIQE